MARVQQKTRGGAQVVPVADQTNRNRLIAVGIVGAVLLVVVLLVVVGSGLGGTPAVQSPEVTGGEAQGRIIGNADAPLLIKDFSDFRCPHCREAASALTPHIIREYVNTGKARLEFIPVSVLGQESTFSAQAALCAETQGKFWEYHDVLFDRQGRQEFSVANLASFAKGVGMDEQQFRDCILSGQFRQQLDDNNRAFNESGGTGTPTFIVGDELVSGAVPFAEMQAVIEAELATLSTTP